MPIDQRNRLSEEPFDYRVFKDNKVEIYWEHRPVMLLKGAPAVALQRKLHGADDKAVQLILAKVTGNFKRGNERNTRGVFK